MEGASAEKGSQQKRLLILKGKGREWGPVYRNYLSLFSHDQVHFSEVETDDIAAVNRIMEEVFDGYIITGSTDDAHDCDDYVLNLIRHIQQLQERKARVVGICYGHQIICRALGGETGPSDKGWGTGPRSTSFVDKEAVEFFQSCLHSYNLWQKEVRPDMESEEQKVVTKLNIFYSHQDQVSQPPTIGDLRCFTGNSHCQHAGFYSPDRSILTIQGHPEFDSELMLIIIDLLNGKGLLTKMGYTETVDDIIENIKVNYSPQDEDGIFSSLLDNMFLGKCITSCLLSL